MRRGPIFFPHQLHVEAFHEVVIRQRGERGYQSRGLVTGTIEWARTHVYNFEPFPSLLTKAAALL